VSFLTMSAISATSSRRLQCPMSPFVSHDRRSSESGYSDLLSVTPPLSTPSGYRREERGDTHFLDQLRSLHLSCSPSNPWEDTTNTTITTTTTTQCCSPVVGSPVSPSSILATAGSWHNSKDLWKLPENYPSRLHVSNIPFRFRQPELVLLFGRYGIVTHAEIIFNDKGSKGFGFVTMSTASSAHLARMCLDGVTVEGRRIEVNPATPKAPLATKSVVTPPVVSSKSPVVKENNIQLRVLEAQARLAEAQVAVLQMQHRIINSRYPSPVLGRNIQLLYSCLCMFVFLLTLFGNRKFCQCLILICLS